MKHHFKTRQKLERTAISFPELTLRRSRIILRNIIMSTFFPCSPQVDAKGAIYLTTKNGTFPISLTPTKPREAAPKIVSSTVQNTSLASSYERVYWETTDEILSNYVNLNVTYGEMDTRYMWKNKRSINDAVSRNITLVLENLLKNYENSQLPTHGKGMILNLKV